MIQTLKICFLGIKGSRKFSTAVKFKNIAIEKLGRITLIGLNHPEKRNCLNLEMLQQLSDAVETFEADTSSDIAVLHGIGGNFCAGYDLTEISKNEQKAKTFFDQISKLNLTNRFIKKPLVAAINGYAVGSGMELALMCDLRVMEESAVMGFLNRRFGIPCLNGGTVRLQKLIGYSCAIDLMLTGRGMHAQEALDRGLLARYVGCGTSLGQAINLASSIIKYPQDCLNADRKSMYYSAYEASSTTDAFRNEKSCIENDIIVNEAVLGANKFLSGIGRHGKFYNLQEKFQKDWEKEA